MNLDYNTGIPAANDNPSDDQPDMLTNTNSINSWVAIDHHGFNDNLGGYHTNIHQDTGTPSISIDRVTGINANIPSAIAGINQLFAALVTTPVGTDTQLISVTGNQAVGQFSQLTGNNASSEGWGWFSGILIQWGGVVTSLTNQSSDVIFSTRSTGMIAFPNNLFVVIPTPFFTTNLPTGSATVSIDTDVLNTNKIKFKWRATTSSSTNYTGFYWIAIGN